MENKSVKAYVLKDGNVVTEDYMKKFAVKSYSKQLPSDAFLDHYQMNNLVEPLYDLESLAQLLEVNTYHNRAVKTKARDVAGLGYLLNPLKSRPNATQKKFIEEFLDNNDGQESVTEVFNRMLVDYDATGNGYIEVYRDQDGNVKGIAHIPAHTIRRHANEVVYVQMRGVRKVYFKKMGLYEDVDLQSGALVKPGTLKEEEKANEIMHFYNYTSRSDYYGVPDIVSALGALLGDKERQEYNISFFENHAVPAYAVTVTGTELDMESQAAIKKYFQEDIKNARHSTLVLSAQKDPNDANAQPIEFKFEALGTENNEASFRMFRLDNRDEILAAHGVPGYRLGLNETGSLGGSTATESTKIYKMSIVNPRQKMLEDFINKYILWDSFEAHDWEFKFNEIDAEDKKEDLEVYSKLFTMGAVTPNELRVKMGLEPIENEAMNAFYIHNQNIDKAFAGEVEKSPLEQILGKSAQKSLKNSLTDLIDVLEEKKADDYE